jgi:hypothetical protein
LRRVREICIESDNLPHNPKRSVVACTSTWGLVKCLSFICITVLLMQQKERK